MVEVAQIAGASLAVLAAGLRINLRRVERQLRASQATSPDRAIAPRLRTPLARLARGRLTAAGAVGSLPDGRLYIDEADWARYVTNRRTRALTVVAVVLVPAAVVWFTGASREDARRTTRPRASRRSAHADD